MRRYWHALFAFLCVTLMLLMGRSLVRGPEVVEKHGDGQTMLTHTAILCMERTADTGNLQTQTTELGTRHVLFSRLQSTGLNQRVLTDRNGYPIRGKTWHEAVYLVCRQEVVPG